MADDKDKQVQNVKLTEEGGLGHLRRTDYKMVCIIITLVMLYFQLIKIAVYQENTLKVVQQQLELQQAALKK